MFLAKIHTISLLKNNDIIILHLKKLRFELLEKKAFAGNKFNIKHCSY